jgi:hypothetical protein
VGRGEGVTENAEQERLRLGVDDERPRPVDRDLDRERQQVGAPDGRGGERGDAGAAGNQR